MPELKQSRKQVVVDKTRTVYVATRNSDGTEGKGHSVMIAACELEATARRLAKGKDVMGSDGCVYPEEMLFIDGVWYIPLFGIHIEQPTHGDTVDQRALELRKAALAKAKAAGLTDDDLSLLGVRN